MNDYPEIRISWTSLRTYMECAQKAKLFQERKKSTTQNVRNFFHGNVADAAMRRWLALPDRDLVPMATLVPILFDEEEARIKERSGTLKWNHRTDRNDMQAYVQELCQRLEPILYEHFVPYEFKLAKRFAVPVNLPDPSGGQSRVILSGELDAIVYKPDGYSIWDLKATKDDSYWRKTIGQLTFYDVAMWAEHKKYASQTGLIQPMCKQQVMAVEVSDESRRVLLSQVSKMALDRWNNHAPVREDNSICGYCECRLACAKFAGPVRNGNRVPFASKVETRKHVGSETFAASFTERELGASDHSSGDGSRPS